MKVSDIFILKGKIKKFFNQEIDQNLLEDFSGLTFDQEYFFPDHNLTSGLIDLRQRYQLVSEQISSTLDIIQSIEPTKETNFVLEMFNKRLEDNIHSQIYLKLKDLNLGIESFKNDLKIYYDAVESELKNQEQLILNASNSLGDDHWTDKQSYINKDIQEQVASKIRSYTDWKYPSLEIGPGEGVWTDNLVGSDPLYLLEIHKEYLDRIIMRYPKKFGDRIRAYLIGKNNDKSNFDFSNLPDNQIGFIFSWDVFDYYTYNEIDLLLESCQNVLRPGGVLTFSYNDCDYISAIKLFEGKQKTWITKKLLLNLFEKHKLNVLEFECNSEEDIFWCSVKKAGEKQSIKTSQPTVLIQPRKGCERFDNAQPLKYNKQQITRIKQLAIKLGIDTYEKIMSDTYDPHELMELVNIARMKK